MLFSHLHLLHERLATDARILAGGSEIIEAKGDLRYGNDSKPVCDM